MKRKATNKSKTHKERFLGFFSSLSGGLSFLGGWQVCHNLCLGIIALLSVVGITVAGMPLLFLTQYTIYFWSIAVLILVPALILYWKNRKCMSAKLLLFNVGIITASTPFMELQPYQIAFWAIGGILIAGSIWMFLKPRLQKNGNSKKFASSVIPATG
ncbi:MAG: hypothetical protein HY514_04705 [Candidatus Aenigmarchaeota archaeon]|nr:hypothetical protein [Candidatus Aenigmarchaeota archaeon]